MSQAIKKKWDDIYTGDDCVANHIAALLIDHAFLLPCAGKALDLACGLGANAMFLAKWGLDTDAWDISSMALQKLSTDAALQGVYIKTCQCDIDDKSLPDCVYDVIVVTRFLDRSLCDAIIGALKPGGLLFYQTYTVEKVDAHGPKNPEYLLSVNELLTLFAPLRVVFYRENGVIGKLDSGLRNEAQFIGKKNN